MDFKDSTLAGLNQLLAQEGQSTTTLSSTTSAGTWSLGENFHQVTQIFNPQAWRLPEPNLTSAISSIGSFAYQTLFPRTTYTPTLPSDDLLTQDVVEEVVQVTFKKKDREDLLNLPDLKTPHEVCATRKLTCLETSLHEHPKIFDPPLSDFERHYLALGTYIEEPALFDLAARQMVEFFSYASLGPACDKSPSEAYTQPGHAFNPIYTYYVPCVAQSKQGKLGKIHLNTGLDFQVAPQSLVSACKRTIKLFPHQLDMIVDAAQALIIKKFQDTALQNVSTNQAIEAAKNSKEYLDLKANEAVFKAIQKQTFNYFEHAYVVHRRFADMYQLFANPIQLICITLAPDREKVVQKAVLGFLRNIHKNPSVFNVCGFLGENSEEKLQKFGRNLPAVIQIVMDHLHQALKENFVKHFPTKPPSNFNHFLMVRNMHLVFQPIIQALKPYVKILESNQLNQKDYAGWILDNILKALAGHEIAAYYPYFDAVNTKHNSHLILC